ncbi:MAG: signal peptidase II, partial [Ruminococcus sp.]|nr:signal peptidase II [Ruminococcus sp.]
MLIIYISIIVILPILAQCIRTLIETNVKPEGFVTVIPGVFSLTYSENRGVAFGLFQDGTV